MRLYQYKRINCFNIVIARTPHLALDGGDVAISEIASLRLYRASLAMTVLFYPNLPVYGFKGNPPPTGMLAPVT
jgi:hypothetical protein